MHNILILAEDKTPFIDIIIQLKKDFFSVFDKPIIFLKTNEIDLFEYDFILFALTESDSENLNIIETIKNNSICPLYIFSKSLDANAGSKYIEFGAEGYIDIPFNAIITASRIKSVLRFINNLKHVKQNIFKIGPLVMRLDSREILFNGNQIQLTNVEFKILKILAEHKNTVVSKDKIIHYVWNEDSSATDNALGIHITRLRKKIQSDHYQMIETIWGLGYRLSDNLLGNTKPTIESIES